VYVRVCMRKRVKKKDRLRIRQIKRNEETEGK
jgi:hypothetical protein